ncbi:MAG TPA: DUF465 domain-containing protein [Beijerinckiaceae bacterium]|nr:DUF465 domain-containing protein [Beijerinckiaceae bacterium]
MSMHSHLVELERRHQALDREIETELVHPSTNELRVKELKRKKLHLKDQIERLRVHDEERAPSLH